MDRFTNWGEVAAFKAAKIQVERLPRILIATRAVVGKAIFVNTINVDTHTGNNSGDKDGSDDDAKVSTRGSKAGVDEGFIEICVTS